VSWTFWFELPLSVLLMSFGFVRWFMGCLVGFSGVFIRCGFNLGSVDSVRFAAALLLTGLFGSFDCVGVIACGLDSVPHGRLLLWFWLVALSIFLWVMYCCVVAVSSFVVWDLVN